MSTVQVSRSTSPFFLLLFLALIAFLGYRVIYESAAPAANEYIRRNKTEKEEVNGKSSGRNGKHANPKARESAEQNYQRVKEEIDRLQNPRPGRSPEKTPEEKELLKKLQKQLEHWKRKKDWTGENHSRKAKGN
jgi:hypothetical protein